MALLDPLPFSPVTDAPDRFRLTPAELEAFTTAGARLCSACRTVSFPPPPRPGRRTPHAPLSCPACTAPTLTLTASLRAGHAALCRPSPATSQAAGGTRHPGARVARSVAPPERSDVREDGGRGWEAGGRRAAGGQEQARRASSALEKRRWCPNCDARTNAHTHCSGVKTVALYPTRSKKKKRRPKLSELRIPRDADELALEAECDEERRLELALAEDLFELERAVEEAVSPEERARAEVTYREALAGSKERRQKRSTPLYRLPPEPEVLEGEVARWKRRQRERVLEARAKRVRARQKAQKVKNRERRQAREVEYQAAQKERTTVLFRLPRMVRAGESFLTQGALESDEAFERRQRRAGSRVPTTR